MTNRTTLRAAALRIATLQAELADPYTASLGNAAVESVRSSLIAARLELLRLRAA